MMESNTGYTIKYESHPKHDDIDFLWKGISENAKFKRGFEQGKSFAFFIRDKLDKIKGGCSGYLYYGCLYVDLLWVDEALRGQHFGSKLIESAENLAKENQCNFIAVNTMDFEALDFYIKLGFYIEFERTGFYKNSRMYFMRKDIISKV